MTLHGLGPQSGSASAPGSKQLHRAFGTEREGDWPVVITPERAGWSFAGLRIGEVPSLGTVTLDTADTEILVVPLTGALSVECDGESVTLAGRTNVFAGVTDFAYVPPSTPVTVRGAVGTRFAVPSATARGGHKFRRIDAADVPIEPRGAANCLRFVRNYCMPDTCDADRLMVCEVITPAGNWSSYPPHKHDEEREGESVLEEVYYFEVADGPSGPGVAFQRVYGTTDRPVDVLAEVRSGDVVLVPHGWHGPSMAMPGYDLYYLNVMAGPGERAWNVCFDPAHAWVRDTWSQG